MSKNNIFQPRRMDRPDLRTASEKRADKRYEKTEKTFNKTIKILDFFQMFIIFIFVILVIIIVFKRFLIRAKIH